MFDKKLAAQLAELGKIAFEDDGLEDMAVQMAHIVQLMDKVKSFSENDADLCDNALSYNDLRRDEAKPSLEKEKITQNAKEVKYNSFVVPKVV